MSTKKNRTPLDDAAPGIPQLGKFLNSLYTESDHGAVLMASSVLDEVLSKIIQAF